MFKTMKKALGLAVCTGITAVCRHIAGNPNYHPALWLAAYMVAVTIVPVIFVTTVVW